MANEKREVKKRSSMGDIISAGFVGLVNLVMLVWVILFWDGIKGAGVNNPIVVAMQGIIGMSASIMIISTLNKQTKVAKRIRYFGLVLVLEVVVYSAMTYGRWLTLTGGRPW